MYLAASRSFSDPLHARADVAAYGSTKTLYFWQFKLLFTSLRVFIHVCIFRTLRFRVTVVDVMPFF